MDHQLASLFMTYCRSREERMPRKTAELIVRILLLNTYWKNKFDTVSCKDEVQSFMLECFNFFFGRNSISSETIRMQCLFYGNFLTQEQFKNHKKEIVLKNSYSLQQKLRKVWHNLTEDFSDMHDDLVKFVLVKENMDDKDDPSAFDEIKVAVNSILPASKFSTFVANNQKNKVAFMNEISSIAAGIRLCEWYANKAGKFMFDIVKVIKETLPKVSEDIHEEILKVHELSTQLQTHLKEIITNDGDSIALMHKKQLLINTTNYYTFIKILKENIDEVAAETYKLDYKFTMCMKELNAIIKTDPITKADKLYPFYKEVSQIWKNLQLEGYTLDFYANLFLELKEYHKNILNFPESHDLEELNFMDFKLENYDELPVLIKPENIRNFSNVTLETYDFCAYYCSLGILVPAVKELGILKFKDSYYGFSSHKAMEYFHQQPIVCIELAKKYMQIMPELIITVCKEEYFGFPVINTFRQDVLPIFISEKSIQTSSQFVKEDIDYSYKWNQWSMRKEAVKCVDLMNKRTHSTQTDLSHFRRDNFSQVFLPKDNWTQTRSETGVGMSRIGIPELYRNIRKSFL